MAEERKMSHCCLKWRSCSQLCHQGRKKALEISSDKVSRNFSSSGPWEHLRSTAGDLKKNLDHNFLSIQDIHPPWRFNILNLDANFKTPARQKETFSFVWHVTKLPSLDLRSNLARKATERNWLEIMWPEEKPVKCNHKVPDYDSFSKMHQLMMHPDASDMNARTSTSAVSADEIAR